jgi:hypothetical protein
MGLAKVPERAVVAAAPENADEGGESRFTVKDGSPTNVIELRRLMTALVGETRIKILNLVEAITPTDAQYSRVRKQALDIFGEQERTARKLVNELATGKVTINDPSN